ncbi:hypothetical protein SAMN05421734_104152 [Pelagirhabdus alkalitolerans]|uniref:Lipoprotein n=1 Tax=Pelagirhabdus alkalitolerans TaxID=1612202 RepID=A0A1G6IW04_9BACI|nr:DUF6612 family protein [Pelagirhabdus alkalitolerans]SDC10600.1 hypothetical protein SAMN05421734_104152 [Pelagirhabdus alkalitolerans]
MKKKRIIGFVVIVLMLILAACGEQSESGESAEDILKESQEVMQELESYAVEMDMNQHIDMGEESAEGMVVHAESFMEITLDPMSFKQESIMDLSEVEGLAGTETDETKMRYLSYFHEEEGMFMEDPEIGNWMKFPESYSNEMFTMSGMQMNPEEQLQFLEQYVTDLSLEEDDEYYHITLMTEEIHMDELMEDLQGLNTDVPRLEEGIESSFGMMELKELDYSITISKDSYYQTEGRMNMVMAVDAMGQAITSEEETHIVMSQFNEIDAVSIPQDVLDNAEEMDDFNEVPGI